MSKLNLEKDKLQDIYRRRDYAKGKYLAYEKKISKFMDSVFDSSECNVEEFQDLLRKQAEAYERFKAYDQRIFDQLKVISDSMLLDETKYENVPKLEKHKFRTDAILKVLETKNPIPIADLIDLLTEIPKVSIMGTCRQNRYIRQYLNEDKVWMVTTR